MKIKKIGFALMAMSIIALPIHAQQKITLNLGHGAVPDNPRHIVALQFSRLCEREKQWTHYNNGPSFRKPRIGSTNGRKGGERCARYEHKFSRAYREL